MTTTARLFVNPENWWHFVADVAARGLRLEKGLPCENWTLEGTPVVLDIRVCHSTLSVRLDGPAPWEKSTTDRTRLLDPNTGDLLYEGFPLECHCDPRKLGGKNDRLGEPST